MESKFTEAYQKTTDDCQETDCDKVIELLNTVIDGEATADEQLFFNSHIDNCVSCFESHQKQQLLKSLVSGHLKRVLVPEALVLSIKAKIQQTV
ncbi:anti-sigma factor [Pontibacter sp. SGAir0037]|uniref:anti-sigma factor family protein n=1 Tax=Pontibacter sp. SGAir0037 TaxID=2571030 RepID=UPI0010CCBBFB|nr:zf-HC2 domain-containing protein [Pontibacter sp. SGAir0037]QCR23484.1 hypothetical protein C1N53_14805 [Pontibacter sp. SGAir0037]